MAEYCKNKDGVHLKHPMVEYTMCGDAVEGWGEEGSECQDCEAQIVTCPRCLDIVIACLEYNTFFVSGTIQTTRNAGGT